MIIAPLILSLAFAVATPSQTVDTTREAFAKCLRVHMGKSLDAKMSDTDYEAAIKTVCVPQRDAFRAAVIALDKASGYSDSDANDDASAQIDDYFSNFSDKFMDYSSSNTRPSD